MRPRAGTPVQLGLPGLRRPWDRVGKPTRAAMTRGGFVLECAGLSNATWIHVPPVRFPILTAQPLRLPTACHGRTVTIPRMPEPCHTGDTNWQVSQIPAPSRQMTCSMHHDRRAAGGRVDIARLACQIPTSTGPGAPLVALYPSRGVECRASQVVRSSFISRTWMRRRRRLTHSS